jgi:hypothetical protein
MSEPINWSEIGKKTQDAAKAETQRQAAEAEEKQRESLRLQKQRAAIQSAAHAAMALIFTRCQEIAAEFNRGATELDLQMTVCDESRAGRDLLSFTVRKDSGFPRISISIGDKGSPGDQGMILVSLQQTRVTGGGGHYGYAIREDGQVTGPNGTPDFTTDKIAESACEKLLQSNYIS